MLGLVQKATDAVKNPSAWVDADVSYTMDEGPFVVTLHQRTKAYKPPEQRAARIDAVDALKRLFLSLPEGPPRNKPWVLKRRASKADMLVSIFTVSVERAKSMFKPKALDAGRKTWGVEEVSSRGNVIRVLSCVFGSEDEAHERSMLLNTRESVAQGDEGAKIENVLTPFVLDTLEAGCSDPDVIEALRKAHRIIHNRSKQ